MSELLGQQLSNYKLTRVLYRGTFADTYLGEHVRMRATASVVALHVKLTEDQTKAFHEMAQRIAGLIHPHIVRTIDCDLYHGTPFLVQEYFPSSMRQLYPEGTQLPLSVVVTYVKQAASALQYAHDQGMTHGDLRPEQMLLRERDKSLLLDGFGLTTLLPIFFQKFMPDNPYLAPELPQQAPQPASDQYSLAAIAYEWLSGASPMLQNEVEQVLNTARAREPEQRFATIRAFATALEQASKSGMEQSIQPLVILAPIASAIAAPDIPDSTVSRPDPPLSSQESASQPPLAEVSQVEPDALPQIPALRAISRRRLLTGLVVGGVVVGSAVVVGTRSGVLFKQQQRPAAVLPSPPKLIYIYQSQGDFSNTIYSDLHFLWSPDGTRIAAMDYRSLTLQVWGAADGGHLITWTAPKASLCTFQWSQNSLLAAWSVGKDQYTREDIVHVRDIINGHDITTYTGHVSSNPEGSGIVDLAFSPDGKRVASVKYGDYGVDIPPVRVWDAMTSATICSIAHNDDEGGVYWSSDGKRILSVRFRSAGDTNLRVWDAQTGASITSMTDGQGISIAPAWSPNGQYIASTAQYGGVVNVWDAHTGQRISSYQHQANKNVRSFAWSPDSTMIASICEGDDRVHVWNATTGKLIFAHGDISYTYIAWSSDSKHIASRGAFDLENSRSFQIWDATSGAHSITYSSPTSEFGGAGEIRWSPDGRFIAVVDEGDSNNDAIYVWQVGWGQTLQQKV